MHYHGLQPLVKSRQQWNAECLFLLQSSCLYACIWYQYKNTEVADLEGSYVDDLLSRVVVEDPEHGQLSTDGLA